MSGRISHGRKNKTRSELPVELTGQGTSSHHGVERMFQNVMTSVGDGVFRGGSFGMVPVRSD